MKWLPPAVIESIDHQSGKWQINRRIYQNGEKSKWWLSKRDSWTDLPRMHMIGFDTLEDAKAYVEAQQSDD